MSLSSELTSPSVNEDGVIRLGILGFGTVGSGVSRMLQENGEALRPKIGGLKFVIHRIGIRDEAKPRTLAPELFTADLLSIVNDPEIDVILELIGGIEPALSLVESAIQNGKHVVTANKEMMAKHGSRLVNMARDRGLDLHYEAAVGGGIPLVQPLKHQLAGNDVLKMMGILNGTTNYILTKMAREGADFEATLAEAQAKGYAEADPTNDVDGYDAVYKISILASIAFGKQIDPDAVYREGIRRINAVDIAYAARFGYCIKLLGIVEALGDDRVLARVHPTMVPLSHPLAHVDDVYNALWLHGDFVGDVMFSGRGAGANPTASAVVGDLVDIGRNLRNQGEGSAIPYGVGLNAAPIDDLVTRFYVRLCVHDEPNVLGAISTVFGGFGISLAFMEMRPLHDGLGEIVFLTHPAAESWMKNALTDLSRMEGVHCVENSIRVEG